jgi:hypothetical protein
MFAPAPVGYRSGVTEDATNPVGKDDTEKDAYPPDAQFGRAAAADAELADRSDAEGGGRGGPVVGDRSDIRAAGKATPDGEEGDPGEASGNVPAARDIVDEQSEESFPASDPPSTR